MYNQLRYLARTRRRAVYGAIIGVLLLLSTVYLGVYYMLFSENVVDYPHVAVFKTSRRHLHRNELERLGTRDRYESARSLKTNNENTNFIYEEELERCHYLSPKAIPREGPIPMLFDTFTFNNELDLLDIRLNSLYDVVDKFILIECTYTFSGKPKPLYFEQIKHTPRFRKFLPKIHHFIINETTWEQAREKYEMLEPSSALQHIPRISEMTEAMERKAWFKNYIVAALDSLPTPPMDDDFILFSDLDEVPRLEAINALKRCTGYDFPVTFHTPVYLFDFGCLNTAEPSWKRVKLIQRRNLRFKCRSSFLGKWINLGHEKICTDELRDNVGYRGPNRIVGNYSPLTLANAGWHMSFFMGLEEMHVKLQSNGHTDRDNDEVHAQLPCMIARCHHTNGKDKGLRYHGDLIKNVDILDIPEWMKGKVFEGDKQWLKFFPTQEYIASLEASCKD